ncbi:hypothetical protein PSPO01_01077 [Paraphaeosphaeria sporulosa]
MGSIAGWEGGAACGLYCGVKFAVAGIAESLRKKSRRSASKSLS